MIAAQPVASEGKGVACSRLLAGMHHQYRCLALQKLLQAERDDCQLMAGSAKSHNLSHGRKWMQLALVNAAAGRSAAEGQHSMCHRSCRAPGGGRRTSEPEHVDDLGAKQGAVAAQPAAPLAHGAVVGVGYVGHAGAAVRQRGGGGLETVGLHYQRLAGQEPDGQDACSNIGELSMRPRTRAADDSSSAIERHMLSKAAGAS